MPPLEIQFELTEAILQELLWRALSPGDLMMMPAFRAALDEQYALVGAPPAGAQVTGISVTTAAGRMYAELTYTLVAGNQES